MAEQHAEPQVRDTGGRVLASLDRQEWLDRPSYRLEHALTFAFAALGRHRERVSNALHGTWLGHPLHPALTSLPTGAVGTAVAMDAASLVPGRASGLRDASRFALGLGILGSLGAAATGLTDWQHTHEESRRVGLVHGVLNGVATGLYVMSWRDRRRGRHARGVVGSALGYGLTLGSGYLGAALVYGSGTGVDKSGARLSVEDWTQAIPLADLDGQPRRVQVADVGVVLYRSDDQVLAVGEYCPHLGAPMSDGWVDRGQIVCPWHGFAVRVRVRRRGARSGHGRAAPISDAGARRNRRGSRERGGAVNAYDVLFEHHDVLRGLCKKIAAAAPASDEREGALDELLITPPTAPEYEDEWQSFVTVLDAHADDEERDLCPPPVDLSEDMLDALGDEMLARMDRLRGSAIGKLHVEGRAAVLRSL